MGSSLSQREVGSVTMKSTDREDFMKDQWTELVLRSEEGDGDAEENKEGES